MFRITVRRDTHLSTLVLEGRLDGAGSPELERQAAVLLADGGPPLVLDLRGLTFVDTEGLERLCALLARGARAIGGSPFVVELLKECSS